MRTITRYCLFQIPGWALTTVLVTLLHALLGLPLWMALTVLGVVVLKDAVLFPFLRIAYQPEPTGTAQLVGLRGVARYSLNPTGYVHVRGELWRARTQAHASAIPAGTGVRVVHGCRMTLTVARD